MNIKKTTTDFVDYTDYILWKRLTGERENKVLCVRNYGFRGLYGLWSVDRHSWRPYTFVPSGAQKKARR